MIELLTTLRDGLSVDDALLQVYGYDIDGLEDRWREAIGAPARHPSALATAQPTPTFVPTIVPISGAQASVPATPSMIPTSSFGEGTPAAPAGPPRTLTIVLLIFCCVFGLLIGVIVLGVIVRLTIKKGGRNG
jgi:hypothetical protein